MSNTEIVNETADIDDIELHEVYVYIADDNMSASVRLGKCDEGYTYDEVMNKLSLNGIKTGIDEEKIRWMILQKIYDQPVEVAFVAVANLFKVCGTNLRILLSDRYSL